MLTSSRRRRRPNRRRRRPRAIAAPVFGRATWCTCGCRGPIWHPQPRLHPTPSRCAGTGLRGARAAAAARARRRARSAFSGGWYGAAIRGRARPGRWGRGWVRKEGKAGLRRGEWKGGPMCLSAGLRRGESGDSGPPSAGGGGGASGEAGGRDRLLHLPPAQARACPAGRRPSSGDWRRGG